MDACSATRHGDRPATHTVTVTPAAGARLLGAGQVGQVIYLCDDCVERYERIRSGSTAMLPALPLGGGL